MIFHLVPKLYNPYSNITQIEILSISIPELKVFIDKLNLKVAKPYPNKSYYVGMLNNSRKARNGVLINLNDVELKTFTVLIKWSVMLNQKTLHEFEHKIINHIEDFEVESSDSFISYDTLFCYADRNFQAKLPKNHVGKAPVYCQPRLDLTNINYIQEFELTTQESEITLPVLEIERLKNHVAANDRMPEKIWENSISFN